MGSPHERGNTSFNKRHGTSLERLARGFAQMAFQGGLVVQAGISSGANFAWRLRPLALGLASLHAAGAHFGGGSAPLHSHPRISGMASQPTSYWRERCMQLPPQKRIS